MRANMNVSVTSDKSDVEGKTKAIPFFGEDDTSSVTPSDFSTDSSRVDSLLEKSLSFFRRGESKSKEEPRDTNLKGAMAAWSNLKPSHDEDCLPCNDILTSNNPFMSLSPYRVCCDSSCSNFVSLLLNSVRREIADMWVYILPGLVERCDALSREECMDLQAWWSGFAEYVFTVLMIVAKALSIQYNEAKPNFGKLRREKRRDLAREFGRCIERLTVTSEIPMKVMQNKVQGLVQSRTAKTVVAFEDMWSCLSSFILQALDNSFSVAQSIEAETGKVMAPGLQERMLQEMLRPPRQSRAAEEPDYVGNVVISLCRWMRDDEAVLFFVNRFLKKRIPREIDALVLRYLKRRKISNFQFDRKPHSEPRKIAHKPSKVTFWDS